MISEMISAKTYVDMYEQGICTRDEVVTVLIAWAAKYSPATYISDLPVEVLAQIKEQVKQPPATISEVIFLHRDPIREQQWFTGAWVWHDFLFNG